MMPLILFTIISYAVCVTGLLDCRKRRWLHIPKTGSTFCLSLQHICCTEQFETLTKGLSLDEVESAVKSKVGNFSQSWSVEMSSGCAMFRKGGAGTCHIDGGHFGLPMNIDFEKNHVLGFFRDPKKRIISSFLDGKHHEGMPPESYANMLSAMNNISRRFKTDHQVNIELASLYVSQPDMFGCQVKMVLGKECSDPLFSYKPLNQSAISLAIQRLQRFKFVGITDHFALSVELFHKMAEHNTEPNVIEFYVARATRDDQKALLLSNLSYHDPYDSVLYREALFIFKANLKRYHLDHHLPLNTSTYI